MLKISDSFLHCCCSKDKSTANFCIKNKKSSKYLQWWVILFKFFSLSKLYNLITWVLGKWIVFKDCLTVIIFIIQPHIQAQIKITNLTCSRVKQTALSHGKNGFDTQTESAGEGSKCIMFQMEVHLPESYIRMFTRCFQVNVPCLLVGIRIQASTCSSLNQELD